ncbi:tyrosine-type recombinase/integrase [Halobacteriales archaeon Cl-PHB]
MSDTKLEPLAPDEALDLYLRDKRTDLADSSLKAHKYRLQHFVRWCDEEDTTNLNGLSGRDMHRYKLWRRDEGDLNKVTVKTQMDTLRVFIRWCESIDAVRPDLHTKVLSPDLAQGENQRDVKLDAADADTILTYLDRFEYASFDHVVMTLLWRTGMRTGTAHALDVADYDANKQRLATCHRPEAGTPLKNKDEGERLIALRSVTCAVLDDWISQLRPDVTDDHDRNPLLATTQGRAHKNTIRSRVYRWTRPCITSGDCPHDRKIATCEATDDQQKRYSKCPSSVAPHAVRRGSITHHLVEDVPETVVGDRMNVGQHVLDKHYDRREEREKTEQRRQYLPD